MKKIIKKNTCCVGSEKTTKEKSVNSGLVHLYTPWRRKRCKLRSVQGVSVGAGRAFMGDTCVCGVSANAHPRQRSCDKNTHLRIFHTLYNLVRWSGRPSRQLVAQDPEPRVVHRQLVAQDFEPRVVYRQVVGRGVVKENNYLPGELLYQNCLLPG